MKRSLTSRWIPALTVLVLLTTTLAPGAAPTAEAQSDEAMFGFDDRVPLGSPCPEGTTFLNDVVGFRGQNLTYCRPDGFSVIRTEAECTQARLADVKGLWVPSGPVCALGGFFLTDFAQPTCPLPFIQVTGTGILPAGELCLRPILRKAPPASIFGVTPVCIESAAVQDAEQAAQLGVGSEFTNAHGVRSVIVSGEPACTFGCDAGFDANCDDKHGDFCAVELDVSTVQGVRACLEAARIGASPEPPG